MDLHLLLEWCAVQGLDPLEVTRTHLELFARHLEDDRGNGPSTIHRRLSTLKSFYRIAEIDDYPRMTTRYDRARGNLDRHANYIVVGFIEDSG